MTERPENEILDPSSDYGPLGPCGCIDYHYSDCPVMTGLTTIAEDRDLFDDEDEWR